MANSLVLEGFLVVIVKWKCIFDSMSRSFQECVYDKFSKMSFYLHPSKYIMLWAFFPSEDLLPSTLCLMLLIQDSAQDLY